MGEIPNGCYTSLSTQHPHGSKSGQQRARVVPHERMKSGASSAQWQTSIYSQVQVRGNAVFQSCLVSSRILSCASKHRTYMSQQQSSPHHGHAACQHLKRDTILWCLKKGESMHAGKLQRCTANLPKMNWQGLRVFQQMQAYTPALCLRCPSAGSYKLVLFYYTHGGCHEPM